MMDRCRPRIARMSADKKRKEMKGPLAPERVAAILVELRKAYPDVVCALNHKSAWELTVATILSAQCTDVRVNLGDSGSVQGVSYTEGYGCRFPAGAGGADSDHWIFSREGEEHSGRGAGW